MHGATTTQFLCVDCNALYHLIKVEAVPETLIANYIAKLAVRPLPARDGHFASVDAASSELD